MGRHLSSCRECLERPIIGLETATPGYVQMSRDVMNSGETDGPIRENRHELRFRP